MASIQLKGMDKLIAKFERFPNEVTQTSKRIVRAAANIVEAESKKQAPVDTGNMRSGIIPQFRKGGLEAAIGPKAKYAQYVHGGTGSYKGGNDFGRPQWNRKRNEYSGGRRAVAPLVPGGIRADKFMDRAAEKAQIKIDKIVSREISKLLN